MQPPSVKAQRQFVPWTRPAPGRADLAPGLALADTAARFAAFAIDLLILFVVDRAIGVIASPSSSTAGDLIESPRDIAVSIAVLAVDALYFIGSWSGGRRATIGQRITRIEVGNAFDGASLTFGQASRRWLAFGTWIGLVNVVPAATLVGGVALSVWTVALLWTTANSPTKQGLHDRFANTVVARHVGGTRSAWLLLFALLAWLIVSIAWTGSLQG